MEKIMERTTITLGRTELLPELHPQKLINRMRKRIRTDRSSCKETISHMQRIWGLERHVAAAILFAEVRLKTVSDDAVEFVWPVHTDIYSE